MELIQSYYINFKYVCMHMYSLNLGGFVVIFLSFTMITAIPILPPNTTIMIMNAQNNPMSYNKYTYIYINITTIMSLQNVNAWVKGDLVYITYLEMPFWKHLIQYIYIMSMKEILVQNSPLIYGYLSCLSGPILQRAANWIASHFR